MLLRLVQQPVLTGADERIAAWRASSMQGEQQPTLVAVMLFPPAEVGDRLVDVFVVQVVQVVIGYLDGEPVLARIDG